MAAEPIPPGSIDPAALPPALMQFLWSEWLPWARGNAVRLDQGRRWCAGEGARALTDQESDRP